MQIHQPAGCNCDGGVARCPVQGKCQQTGVVYRACTKENASGRSETYTGLTGRKFMDRWKEHGKDKKPENRTSTILSSHVWEHGKDKKPENRTSTMLSSHVWDLKDRGLDFTISWKILDRGPSYNPVSKKCILCLKEKYFIMYHPESSTLNKRSEVFNTCRHRKKSLLSKVKRREFHFGMETTYLCSKCNLICIS